MSQNHTEPQSSNSSASQNDLFDFRLTLEPFDYHVPATPQPWTPVIPETPRTPRTPPTGFDYTDPDPELGGRFNEAEDNPDFFKGRRYYEGIQPNERGRYWVGTWNNYPENYMDYFNKLEGVTYLLIGKEVGPRTGTPHLQWFLKFRNYQRSSYIQNNLIQDNGEWSWFRLAIGNETQCVNYCKKTGNFEEHGDVRIGKSAGGKATAEENKRKWDEAKALAREGRIDEINSQIYVCHYPNLKRIAADAKPTPQDLPEDTILATWIWGASRTGKSRYVRGLHPRSELYTKTSNNKWWCNYNYEDYVLMDDLDRKHDYMIFFLKVWLDPYIFQAEAKFGNMTIRPKHIYITSNVHPRDIWTDPADIEPLLERINLIWFARPGDVCHYDDDQEVMAGYQHPRRRRLADSMVGTPVNNEQRPSLPLSL